MATASIASLVREFNLYPGRYLDRSWLPDDWREHLPAELSERASDILSRWLLDQYRLTDQFDFDFDAPEKRLALLDHESFQMLARYLGLVSAGDALRTVVDREGVEALRARLGSEDYEFLLHAAPALDIAAVGPAVDPCDPQWEAKAARHGAHLLAAVLHGQGRAIGARAQLKLPRAQCGEVVIALSSRDRARVRDVAILSIVEEVLTQWQWLF
jgi:YOP proteins translocation protein K (YscK)